MAVSFPVSSPFTSGTVVTKTQLDALTNAVNALSRGLIGDAKIDTGVTLATSGAAMYTSGVKVTFTLTDTRRVRIVAQARYSPSGSTGRLSVQPGYNTGSSISLGSVTLIGQPGTAGGGTVGSATGEGTALLSAGTYTAYVAVGRVSAGSATDQADTFYVAVHDEGNT